MESLRSSRRLKSSKSRRRSSRRASRQQSSIFYQISSSDFDNDEEEASSSSGAEDEEEEQTSSCSGGAFDDYFDISENVLASVTPLPKGFDLAFILQHLKRKLAKPAVASKFDQLIHEFKHQQVSTAEVISQTREILKDYPLRRKFDSILIDELLGDSLAERLSAAPLPKRGHQQRSSKKEKKVVQAQSSQEVEASSTSPTSLIESHNSNAEFEEEWNEMYEQMKKNVAEKFVELFAVPGGRKRNIKKPAATTKNPPTEAFFHALNPNRANPVGDHSYGVKDEKIHVQNSSTDPFYSMPSHLGNLNYKKIEIVNVNDPNASVRVREYRVAGTPFILEGHDGWLEFAKKWVNRSSSSSSGSNSSSRKRQRVTKYDSSEEDDIKEELEKKEEDRQNAPYTQLNVSEFIKGISQEEVPVITKNYEEKNPIKKYMSLKNYVEKYWKARNSALYLHQWQFTRSPKASKVLCYQHKPTHVLGENLLNYWLDTCRGDCPLQYLFMGGKTTVSRMHQDPGGLAITIAPIVGVKRVTLLHRDVSKLESIHADVNFHEVNLKNTPLLSFFPCWQGEITTGQILFMPEGTFHACENVTGCLSYHRFHLDTLNLKGFFNSFMAQDAPEINHPEILWNATHDVIGNLEDLGYNTNVDGAQSDIQMGYIDSLRGLRHIICALSLEAYVPIGPLWDWTKLLSDIDYQLAQFDPQQIQSSQSKQKIATPTACKTSTSPAVLTHWQKLRLKVGDFVMVQVFRKVNRCEVLDIRLNMPLFKVHYLQSASIYDEYVPFEYFVQADGSQRGKKLKSEPAVYNTVLAKWGRKKQLYEARVLKRIVTNTCLVRYCQHSEDWNQWVVPQHIIKKID